MEILQKLLNIEEVNYSSTLNELSLKKKIEALFTQRALNISGRLKSANEFTAYDKLVVIGWNMPNLRRKSAYLTGIITPREMDVLIKLKTKPNSILAIYAVVTFLIGLVVALLVLAENGTNNLFFILGLSTISLGLIYYFVSIWLRNRLRNKIVRHLDLIKLNVCNR